MTLKKINILIVLLMAVALLMLVVPVIAYADNHHKHHDDDGDVIVDLTGGDNTASNVATNSISGGRSYGLGLGDVDINDCLYSWSFIVQGVGLNKWCASERMDAMGLHDSAALMRCTIRSVNKLYENKEQCIKSQTVVETLHVERPEEITDTDEDDNERYEALYARMAAYEAERVQDKANTEKATQRANTVAQAANTRLNKAETERKAYAKRMLEQLPEYNNGE